MNSVRSGSTWTDRSIVLETRRRREPILARPQAVGVAVAGALALVVTAVFTMAELAGRVSSQSARVQALNVVSDEVEAVRFHLAAATILREADDEAVYDNLMQAEDRLAVLAEVDGREIGLTGPEFTDFVTAGSELTDAFVHNSVDQPITAEVLDGYFTEFSAAHSNLSDRLASGQDESLDSIVSTNRLLSNFGALGGGLLAFVVPLVALYVQRRLGRRRLASYEFDANMRWLLTASELTKSEMAGELEGCLTELSEDQTESATLRLERVIDRLRLEGYGGSEPRPVDVVDLFTNRPKFPGLRRSTSVEEQPIVNIDPTIVAAAFGSMEWAVSQAGGDELVLSTGPAGDSWQELEIQGRGGIDADTLEEIVGPLRSIESALASTGLPFTVDGTRLRWRIEFPLSEPTPV